MPAAAAAVGKNLQCCSRCGECVRSVDPAKFANCPDCGAVFHKRCYLADTGMASSERSASTPCVLCLAGQLREDRLPFVRPRGGKLSPAERYARELLLNGFVVVPLTPAAASTPPAPSTGEVICGEARRAEEADALASLETLRARVLRLFAAFRKSYDQLAFSGKPVPSLDTGFSNFRMRCHGRYELLHPDIPATLSPLINASIVPQVVALAFGSHRVNRQKRPRDEPSVGDRGMEATTAPVWKTMSSGCFLSLPDAAGQNLHTDGPRLSEVVDLYPYAINCFVPLVDVGPSNGTEFHPGTQRREQHVTDATTTATSSRAERARVREAAAVAKKVVPRAAVGEAVLFDYRVLHRGMPNKACDPRPCAYVTFAQRWYTDTYNFGTKRYGGELAIAEHFSDDARSTRVERRAAALAKSEPSAAAAAAL